MQFPMSVVADETLTMHFERMGPSLKTEEILMFQLTQMKKRTLRKGMHLMAIYMMLTQFIVVMQKD